MSRVLKFYRVDTTPYCYSVRRTELVCRFTDKNILVDEHRVEEKNRTGVVYKDKLVSKRLRIPIEELNVVVHNKNNLKQLELVTDLPESDAKYLLANALRVYCCRLYDKYKEEEQAIRGVSSLLKAF